MWYKNAYRRLVIDQHIPEWNEPFYSEFDPHAFLEMLLRAQTQSIVLYAQSHTGLFNYPTQVGAQHKGWKGRDIFGELVDLCHQNKVAVVAYTSVIYDRWASDQHPEWRVKRMDQSDAESTGRFGLVCPNSPYRDFAKAWTTELLSRYAVDGIRFDMTFWPEVPCYCEYCRERYSREVGGEIPQVIHWEDPRWVAFQRGREAWLAEFAGLLTAAARKARPGASVEHQASLYARDWRLGVSDKLLPHNDFLQGDFADDPLRGSFVRKMLHNYSPNLPFGVESAACIDLSYHTTLCSPNLMQMKTYAALSGQAAMVFIDAIDPTGTLNPITYDRIGKAFTNIMPFEPYLGGDLVQDVAIYFSLYSKYNPADNGKSPLDPTLANQFPHIQAAMGACAALIAHHIPFGVVTRLDLHRLSRHSILVLPNVLMMDAEEVEAIRRYVMDGGNLYVSKDASILTADGYRQPDFLLADVLGVHYQGETKEKKTYISPESGFEGLLPDYSPKYPLFIDDRQTLVSAGEESGVMARITLPYTDPADITRFASIHSNPPGIQTHFPSLVMHTYGKGKVIYSAASLENADYTQPFFINLLELFQRNWSFEVTAPVNVEVTLFHQAENQRYIINLLNTQPHLPVIPVDDIRVKIRLEGATPERLMRIPGEEIIPFEQTVQGIEFRIPRMDEFCMFCLTYTALPRG